MRAGPGDRRSRGPRARPRGARPGLLLSFALLLVGGAAVACATARGGARQDGPSRAAERDLPNLGQVDAGVWRSGQPTAEGFRVARSLGVRTVLDLRSLHDDRPLLEGTGLASVTIPMQPWDADDAAIAAAVRVLGDPALRPVLVHCAQGRDRTGVVVAAYRRAVHGWGAEPALAEMTAFRAAPWWPNLSAYVRRLDPEALRARAEGSPAPVLRAAR